MSIHAKLDNDSNYLIKIKDLKKNYGRKKVLKGLNLTINKQDRIAIIGANGNGKTTLVEIISGIRDASGGDIYYNLKNKAQIKESIGIQFQEAVWPVGIKLKDVLQFFVGIYSKTVSKEKIDEMEEAFQVKEYLKFQISNLSGGQKQRINALLAIISNPEVLILDEISTGLDIEAAYQITDYINNYITETKKTLILVSHRTEEIEQLCNRMVILEQGKIIYDDKIINISKKFGSLNNFLVKYFSKKIDIQKINNNDKLLKNGKE